MRLARLLLTTCLVSSAAHAASDGELLAGIERAAHTEVAQLSVAGIPGIGAPGALLFTPVVAPTNTPDLTTGAAFVGDAYIGITSALGTTDATTLAVSTWIHVWTGGGANSWKYAGGFQPVMANNTATLTCEANSTSGQDGLCIVFTDGSGTGATRAQLNFNDSTGTSGATHGVDISTGLSNTHCPNTSWLQGDGNWHWYVAAVNTTTGHVATYIDGVDMIAAGCASVPTITSNLVVALNDSHGLALLSNAISGQGNSHLGWLGPTWISTDPNLICSSTTSITTTDGVVHACTGANTIPRDILQKMATCTSTTTIGTCKPYDLGATGTVPTGRQPEVYVLPNGPTVTNRGSGAALGVISTNTGGLAFTAPYGPYAGVPAHAPTLKWEPVLEQITGGVSTMVAHLPTGSGYANLGVSAGDLIVIMAESSGSTTQPADFLCPTGGANTWTAVQVAGVGFAVDTTDKMTTTVCYTTATAGDLTGPWTLTLDAAGTGLTGARTTAYVMFDYTTSNVSGASPLTVDTSATGGVVNTAATTSKSKSGLSTTAANEVLLQLLSHWDVAAGTGLWTYPTGYAGRFHVVVSGSPAQMMFGDITQASAGAIAQATFGLARSDVASVFTLGVKPN